MLMVFLHDGFLLGECGNPSVLLSNLLIKVLLCLMVLKRNCKFETKGVFGSIFLFERNASQKILQAHVWLEET